MSRFPRVERGKRGAGVTRWILLLSLHLSANVIQPLPVHMVYDTEKALLGKQLFFDPKLSKDGTVACVTCHQPDTGADHRRVSTGIAGRKGSINTPTVFNSYFNFRQMWNGSVETLNDQVRMPLHNPVEMDMDAKKIIPYLRQNKRYAERFRQLYGRAATLEDMSNAIAEFEKALITPNSPFDLYLRGKKQLNKKALEGYRLFKSLGCVSCHNGINIGGNSFQKIGLIHHYRWSIDNPDRFTVTGRNEDKNVYKVPSLRNVAITGPYFHDGSVPTLKKALEIMAYHNLGFELNPDEIEKLTAFLRTLTGEKPAILRGEE